MKRMNMDSSPLSPVVNLTHTGNCYLHILHNTKRSALLLHWPFYAIGVEKKFCKAQKGLGTS